MSEVTDHWIYFPVESPRASDVPSVERESGTNLANWMEQILYEIEATHSEHEAFEKIAGAVREVGFEYSAYYLHTPWPLSRRKVLVFSNFPEPWQRRYHAARYIDVDPLLRRGRQSYAPIVWSDAVFEETPQLWEEAQAHGLRHGYSLAAVSNCGVSGMLSMARSHTPLTVRELQQQELKMRWLVNAAHLAITRAVLPKLSPEGDIELTDREVEVLKWVADGKTATEISMIMLISVYTVNFHVKNAVTKLNTSNATAAVARAAMLGLLV
ncbi:autoinducer binding domain-containing protein [Burkholderia gladioli]|uniref:autoinducer binding domain-containing protein n=2 Tax=Burkholderia gladioli TaxID=28095 RepID=UPI001FC8D3CC|nr:autoinducer binding domain-containing protein [Burkholderia gladioli]